MRTGIVQRDSTAFVKMFRDTYAEIYINKLLFIALIYEYKIFLGHLVTTSDFVSILSTFSLCHCPTYQYHSSYLSRVPTSDKLDGRKSFF